MDGTCIEIIARVKTNCTLVVILNEKEEGIVQSYDDNWHVHKVFFNETHFDTKNFASLITEGVGDCFWAISRITTCSSGGESNLQKYLMEENTDMSTPGTMTTSVPEMEDNVEVDEKTIGFEKGVVASNRDESYQETLTVGIPVSTFSAGTSAVSSYTAESTPTEFSSPTTSTFTSLYTTVTSAGDTTNTTMVPITDSSTEGFMNESVFEKEITKNVLDSSSMEVLTDSRPVTNIISSSTEKSTKNTEAGTDSVSEEIHNPVLQIYQTSSGTDTPTSTYTEVKTSAQFTSSSTTIVPMATPSLTAGSNVILTNGSPKIAPNVYRMILVSIMILVVTVIILLWICK